MDLDRIVAMPIRWFDRATKRVLFELADGRRFYLVGGRDRRPLPKGVAGFSPREMTMVLEAGLSEDEFKQLIFLKEKGIAVSIQEITKEGSTNESKLGVPEQKKEKLG